MATRRKRDRGEVPPEASLPRPKRDRSWRRFSPILQDARDLVWRSRRRLILALPLMFISRLAGIVIPGTTKFLLDDVIAGGRHALLPIIAAVAVTAALVDAIAGFALAQLLGIAAQQSITNLRTKIHQHLQRLPVRYFDANKSGNLVSRVMTDAEGIRNLVGTGIVQLFGSLITAALAIAALIYLSAKLTLLILTSLILFSAVVVWAFATLRPLYRKRGEITGHVYGRLSENLSGIKVVKAYRAERREALVFAHEAHRLLRNVVATMKITSGVMSLSTFLIGIGTGTLLLVGGKEVIAGRMTVGELMTFALYLGLVIAPVIQIVSIGSQLSEAFAGLERMRQVFDEKREDSTDATALPIGRVEGKVEFRDVHFEYTHGVPVLRGISLLAPPGSATALVGPSGSGKSTLISLIAAFHRPTSGSVLIDGEDLSRIRLSDYRANVGLVLQDSFLFSGSIRENIALGNSRAGEAEILRAARIAHVDEFAEAFADGYGTVVGERGVRLSGGQKQRVTIARAILADPRILILDEATSSLDSESEALIQDGLRALTSGRTTFVIAHRLSTIRGATQILFLEKGEITERGTHDELLAMGGRYKRLYETQYGIEKNLFVNPGEEVSDFQGDPLEVAGRG